MAHRTSTITFAITLVLLRFTPSWGVKPAETLLPDTTCLYVSFPDMNSFRARFDATQIGKLARDPVMKPFAEDLRGQLQSRFGDTDIQFGLTWEDLAGIYAGEACLARIQPGAEKGQHATAMLIDVTGKKPQVAKVRATIDANMAQRGATKEQEQIEGCDVTVYHLKREIGERLQREVFVAVVKGQFLLVNHREELTSIIQRSKQAGEGTLKDSADFKSVMDSVATESNLAPDVRWFMDPFTYAEVVRSARGQRRRRGRDLRQLLEGQGFDAIRAFGGHINLATKDLEVLHRTLVYAPPVTGDETKYLKAARMLDFPSAQQLPTEPWIPRKLATFASFNWKIRSAFEYSISLIDEYVDPEGGFVEDVLKDFEMAKEGPKINIRTELLDYLGERVITFSDYYLPMTTTSERVFVAISVTDEAKVQDALRKLWQDGMDPTVEKREYKGLTIWEIVPEEEDDLGVTLVPPVGGIEEKDDLHAGGPAHNAAMTVARGYLLVSTHLDYLQTILDDRKEFDSLGQSADFQYVNKKLNQLGGGQESFRFFSRKDEEYQSAYEMIRRGKMPESESMLARVLNRFLGPEEDGVLRKQKVDGSKMPPYDVVRRYLGPGGSFVTSRPDGWLITGIVVNKEHLVRGGVENASALTTSP